MPMPNKHGSVGIYNEKLPSIELQGPLITWFCKVM